MIERRQLFEAPVPSSGVFLPEVDGLRAVASINVLVCHAMFGSEWLPSWVIPLVDGGVGVQLFFVLSGFLLSLPFLRAKDAGERVELGPYALRRMLRILPAYYVSLAFSLLFLWPEAFTTRMGLATILAHLTLTFSASEAMVRAISPVYWTLCVEEQFYLALPLLAMLFARRRGALFIAATLPLPNLMAAAYRPTFGKPGVLLTTSLPYHWTAFGLGIMVAVLFHERSTRRSAFPRAVSIGMPFAAAAGLVLLYASTAWKAGEPGLLQAWAVGWAVVLGGVLFGPRWLGAPLRWRPVRILGLMTFSIYLWHFPVVARVLALSDAPSTALMTLARIGTVFVFTLPFAAGSYLLVERPFLDLRRRLERGRLKGPQPPVVVEPGKV